MKHLSPEVLGALLDGALNDTQRADAERHLQACAECRSALAVLVAQDDLTMKALEHDPGTAYYESFAERVTARVAAEDRAAGAATASRPAPRAWGQALWTPRGMAFAGSAAALLVVGVLALVQSRSSQGVLTDSKLAARAEQRAMAPGIAEREQAPLGAGSQDADKQEARGEVHRQLAVGRADGRVTKEAADAPQASAFSAEPAPAAAPTTQSAPSSEGAARNEAAPLAQQAVIPSTTLEERPARERKVQDVGASDALSLRDAAPAQDPSAGKALEKAGNVPEAVLRSLKARRAAPLEGHDGAASPQLAAKALAAGPSRSGGRHSLDELDAKFQWPASLRPLVARAESLTVIANTTNAAGDHDRAARAWERVLGASSEGSDAQLEAQSRSAFARRDAWRSGPTAARKTRTVEALQDLLVLLPPGPRRHEAELRLGEVMRSGE